MSQIIMALAFGPSVGRGHLTIVCCRLPQLLQDFLNVTPDLSPIIDAPVEANRSFCGAPRPTTTLRADKASGVSPFVLDTAGSINNE